MRHIAGHKVTDIAWQGEDLGYQVSLDNGTTHQGKLLIGAGWARLYGTPSGRDWVRYFGVSANRNLLRHQNRAATQGDSQTSVFADRAFGTLPLADVTADDQANPQHWQSVVWTLPTNAALDLLSLPPKELAKELALASGYALGDITEIESIASFPLGAQHATKIMSKLT